MAYELALNDRKEQCSMCKEEQEGKVRSHNMYEHSCMVWREEPKITQEEMQSLIPRLLLTEESEVLQKMKMTGEECQSLETLKDYWDTKKPMELLQESKELKDELFGWTQNICLEEYIYSEKPVPLERQNALHRSADKYDWTRKKE